VPWLALTGTMLAESVTYPAFCWALFLMQRAIAKPSPPRRLGRPRHRSRVLRRTQLAILAPAFVVAVLVHEATFPFLGASAA